MSSGRRYSEVYGIDTEAALAFAREQSRRAEQGTATPAVTSIAPVPRTLATAGSVGRPPSPWAIHGAVAVDMLNEGRSVREVADEAKVHPRTLARVLLRCGFIRARAVRSEVYAEWLPATLVHHVDELAEFRRHLWAIGAEINARSFAALCGMNPTALTTAGPHDEPPVWSTLANVDSYVAQGRDWAQERCESLPGESDSPWGVRPDRTPNPSTTPRIPRRDRRRGGAQRVNGVIDQHKTEIIYKYAQGETIAYMARYYEVSHTTLHRRLNEWGVVMRDAHRRGSAGGAHTGTELRFPDDEDGGS